MSRSRMLIIFAAIAAGAAMMLSACDGNDSSSSGSPSALGNGRSSSAGPSSAGPSSAGPSSAGPSSAGPSGAASHTAPATSTAAGPAAGSGRSTTSGNASATATTKDATLAALVPPAAKIGGRLVVGIDPIAAPDEYLNPTGRVIGFDVDLFDAVAAKLGLPTRYVTTTLDKIIPGVIGRRYSIGVSSIPDTTSSEQQVDLVDYFRAGTQWASATGRTVDPNRACGLTVAVRTGTTQAVRDLPGRSAACTRAGKQAITIRRYATPALATAALAQGRVDALAADSPITAYAMKRAGGRLQRAGAAYGAVPYGYVISRADGIFKQAVQKAVQALIDDGTYATILARWDTTAGAIATSTINGAPH